MPRGASQLGQFFSLRKFPPISTSQYSRLMIVQEKHDIPGSRGEANFVWKCKLCGVRHLLSSSKPEYRCLTMMMIMIVENALGVHNSRSTRVPNRREPQRQNSKDYWTRLSRFGVYGVQGWCTYSLLPLQPNSWSLLFWVLWLLIGLQMIGRLGGKRSRNTNRLLGHWFVGGGVVWLWWKGGRGSQCQGCQVWD